jgi:glutathione S-transferase
MNKLVALLVVCLPLQASAEVMHYSKCKLNAGKTIADVQTWLNDWRSLVKKEKIEYRVRLLLPHADSQLGADQFFIEGGSPTLASYAAAWQWWYTNPNAEASNKQLTAAATCDSGAVYRSTD